MTRRDRIDQWIDRHLETLILANIALIGLGLALVGLTR